MQLKVAAFRCSRYCCLVYVRHGLRLSPQDQDQNLRLSSFDTKFPRLDIVLCLQVANADVIIPTTSILSDSEIRAAQKLKLVVNPSSGHNNIAVEACTMQHVPVCTCPGKPIISVLPQGTKKCI